MENNFIENQVNNGAVISECGKYRFRLWRNWDSSKPKVLFIMLNPSTADHFNNDPTIRRCISFAKSWGYGGIMVGNLDPMISTDPKKLKRDLDEETYRVFDKNMQAVMAMSFEAKKIILAWGNPPKHVNTASFWTLVGGVSYLGLTKSGEPKHPLYLRKDLIPIDHVLKSIFG